MICGVRIDGDRETKAEDWLLFQFVGYALFIEVENRESDREHILEHGMSLTDFSGASDHSTAMIKYLELGHIVNNQSTVCSYRSSKVQDQSAGIANAW